MQDVYAYGVIAPSTLYVLEDDFPPQGGYAEIVGIFHSTGGEAANSAFTLSKLGVTAKLDGNWLSNDEDSRRTIKILSADGLDCSNVALKDNYLGVKEIIFTSGNARTIFGTYKKLVLDDPQWNEPRADDIRSSRLVCLDPFFGKQSETATGICIENNIPYVTVDVKPDNNIARHAEALIISEEFSQREFPTHAKEQLFELYSKNCNGLTVLTFGSETVLFGRKGSRPSSFTPFKVDVKDTTGAGDAFRAGLIYGMLKGQSDKEKVKTGCALAGMVCERFPGVLNGPTEQQLLEFISRCG
jgi:ribokinase